MFFIGTLLVMPAISSVVPAMVGTTKASSIGMTPADDITGGAIPASILAAAQAGRMGTNGSTPGNDMAISAAVFSQAEDPTSGIEFTYRAGVSVVAGFGASVVYYVMSNITTLQLAFPGSSVVLPRGVDPLASKTSYFYGSDPSKWRAGLTDFGGVLYEDIYPGIDLHYKTVDGSLKYEFVVHAGADPGRIAMDYTNADGVSVQPGEVRVNAGGATMRDTGLAAYQEMNGAEQHGVPCEFAQQTVHGVVFVLGTWNHARDLVIDPLNILAYSTYIGGSGYIDEAYSIAVDNGAAYITGLTNSSTFPTTAGAYDRISNGYFDAFVTKLSIDGSVLLYSTYLGGNGNDNGIGIAVDNGAAYVTGTTSSDPFPTTAGAYNRTYGNYYDVFVTKLSVDGSNLLYSTYIGGSGADRAFGLAVDNGFAYVTGWTDSDPFPTTAGAYDTTFNGGIDTFVTELSANGSNLLYSTYLGGNSQDLGYGIAVENGIAYITGNTQSDPFPTTAGAYDTTFNGGPDVFVAKFSSNGSALLYSTYLGGNGEDEGYGIAVDDGDAYVTGYTGSYQFPTTAGAYDTTYHGIGGLGDVFLAKFSADGNTLLYSTYFGGNSVDRAYSVAVDNGAAYVTGFTWSDPFPTTPGAFETAINGGSDAFVAKLTGDDDNDGMHDDWEISHGLNPQVNDAGGDFDADGLTNLREFTIKTLPNCADTDSDGRPDGIEITMGCNPLVPDVQHRLEFSTYIGGGSDDRGYGIFVDNGVAYITGYTTSNTFPRTLDAYDKTYNGGKDVFVAKLSADGNTMIYSTYLGGSGDDEGKSIAVYNGAAYVTGNTYSNPFPTTAGANDTTYNGGMDTFVAKLSVNGSTLLYSTYLGGSGNDYAYGIAVDYGAAYVTGWTGSDPFPTTASTYDRTFNSGTDAFVAKLSINGSSLLYSTYLGGSGSDLGYSIAVNKGAAYVTGYTTSDPFPTTAGAYNTTYNGGPYDTFVTKFSANGSTLLYSTYLGGSGNEYGTGIAVDNGAVYVLGYTGSSLFPTTAGAYDMTYNGGSDVFVSKLSPDGSTLLYSTYLGGTGDDYGYGIAVDNGVVYVTGATTSNLFPTTVDTFDMTYNGGTDAFLIKLSPDGSTLLYSTYLGGTGDDYGYGIAAGNGVAYVTGYTSSNPFPTTAGTYETTYNGGQDTFVAKIAQDIDGDGMPDGWEIAHGLNFQVNDAGGDLDADGLTNINEFLHGTRPDQADTDGDGMPDGWEVTQLLNPLANDAVSDADNDGLVNLAEYQHGTNATSSDTDGDAMPDGWEVAHGLDPKINDAGGDLDADGLTNLREYAIGTLPSCPDTDNDGRPDGLEITMGCNPLVPDVQHRLEFSTYLGGSAQDVGTSIAVENGCVYITGYTSSNPFPTTAVAFDRTFSGGTYDVFVAKLSADGSALLYSTYLGGNGIDAGQGIAVENGAAYITGYSTNTFPTTAGAYNRTFSGGTYDAFVAKLSTDGSALLYSTFLGGSGVDIGNSIAVENGAAYVTGGTDSSPFPTTAGAFNRTFSGGTYDVFVAKISASGNMLLFSTYIGGSGYDRGFSIAVENGAAFITGWTNSDPFPTTAGAYDMTWNGGGFDSFVTKVSANGGLLYSTYLGGSGNDYGYGIAVENGAAYITGFTTSNPFPTTAGAYNITYGGGTFDAFVTKLSTDGSTLLYSTYIGGSGEDRGYSIAVENGAAYITGYTISNPFPTTADAYDMTWNGEEDAFVAKLSADGSALLYSTYLGSWDHDNGNSIAVENGDSYVAGYTTSSTFPTTAGAYDTTYNGSTDVFVAIIAQDIDGDGMPDTWETAHSLNPQINDVGSDLDGDSVTNMNEFLHGTRPDRADTDGDGMPDGWEVAQSLNPLVNDAASNADGDGLLNLAEYQHGTNATSSDTDGDGMPDGWEVTNNLDPLFNDAGQDTDTDGLTCLQEYQHGTNPNLADTDGDGMPDGWEVAQSLNPNVNDAASNADGDGLLNLAEYQHSTNATSSDTDGDGMPDGWEVTSNLDPLFNDAGHDPDSDGLTNFQEYQHGTNPDLADTDGDGMPDGWEVVQSLNPLVNDAASDTDIDGLTNLGEFQHGANATSNDTDGDGLSDGNEVNVHHTDPLANADADGDDLADVAEINTYLTDPYDIDTDNDGFSDGAEVSRGTDPLDMNDYPRAEPAGTTDTSVITWIVLGISIATVVLVLFLYFNATKQIQRQAREIERISSKTTAKKDETHYAADLAPSGDVPPARGSPEPTKKNKPKPRTK